MCAINYAFRTLQLNVAIMDLVSANRTKQPRRTDDEIRRYFSAIYAIGTRMLAAEGVKVLALRHWRCGDNKYSQGGFKRKSWSNSPASA
jgi:hypothetical protein